MMKKALFLDRDGVINVEKEYLYKIDDFEYIEGIIALMQHFTQLGYMIFVVTNQSGIARGYYTQEQFLDLSAWMLEDLQKKNISIQEVFYCPHHPDISGECECRKPKPGMLLAAAKKYNVDLEHSMMIGDKQRDILAGINAGLRETYLFDEQMNETVSKASKIVSKLDDIWKTDVNIK
jgi:D-glycero-D-manno-heptose 1,7-bisphosphate phosphatase